MRSTTGDLPVSDPSTSFSLLGRALEHDEQAWEQLVHLYAPLVERWCRKAGLQESDAADVFQETFCSLSSSLPSFQQRKRVGAFRAWLKCIVRNKIIDHARKAGHQPDARGGSDAQMNLANVADPLGTDPLQTETADEANEENALVVRRAMELIRPNFTEQNWQAFTKVAIEGQAAADVAAELNVNASAVRQANYRVRRRLRDVLHDLMEE